MGRQEQKAGQGPLAELLDDGPVAEVGIDPPVGGNRAEVYDANVAPRRGLLFGRTESTWRTSLRDRTGGSSPEAGWRRL